MSNNQTPHPASIKTYLMVFGALAFLTGLTVALSYMGLPHHKAILIALLIALTKCTLIATFFMHLKSESKGIYALIFTALFFVGVLILAIIPDIGFIK